MGVGAALTVLVLFIAFVDVEGGGVTFWRKKFTMTCPGEDVKWYRDSDVVVYNQTTYEVEYDNSNKGLYSCHSSDTPKYYFYVQGKVCDNCFELDANLFLCAIVVDMAGTVVVMFIIYNCTKKKSSDESSDASNAPPRSRGGGPPPPNPDYEPLNPHTQNQDPYSRLN